MADTVFTLGIFILIILTVGEPDLLDALTSYIQKCK